jgi:hypothetical protein
LQAPHGAEQPSDDHLLLSPRVQLQLLLVSSELQVVVVRLLLVGLMPLAWVLP